jgi:2-methylcitrate dehydratase PrpD
MQTLGTVVAAAAATGGASAWTMQDGPARAEGDLTGRLARYMAGAREMALPPEVVHDAKLRVLDTLGAMVSGSRLKAGQMAAAFVRAQGGIGEASVAGTNIRTSAMHAAFANAMSAHADETDDFEPVTKAHPGCVTLPSALAMGEHHGRSGMETLRAFVLGYDVCCRFLMALGPDHVRQTHRSAEGVSSTLGSLGAAASLARLDETGMRYAISYAVQQVSGIWSWERDSEHVEKAFDFCGMGARNGVTAALFVESGFTGVRDVLEGEHNALEALSQRPQPEAMVADLGRRFYVRESAIKVFSVGYPIQAPLDAVLTLRRENGLTPANVQRIVVKLPPDAAGIVDNREMPDVNVQYCIAVALIDGTVSFEDSHSRGRMADPEVLRLKQRVQLVADPTLRDPAAPRGGLVEVTTVDGRTVSHYTKFPPGTKENPLDDARVAAKARALLEPVLGKAKTDTVVARVNGLETLRDVKQLTAALVV